MAVSYTMQGIREGLVANLGPLGIQSTGYVLSAPTPPSIEVFPGAIEYDRSFRRGYDLLNYTVRVTVSVTLDIGAQTKLDEYLLPTGTVTSVRTLLEADRTLGGIVQDLAVVRTSGYQVAVGPQGGQVLSCDWFVEIHA